MSATIEESTCKPTVEWRINVLDKDGNVVTFIPLTDCEATKISTKFLCNEEMDPTEPAMPLNRRTWGGERMRTPIHNVPKAETVYMVKGFMEDNAIATPGDWGVLLDVMENGDKYAEIPLTFEACPLA